MVVEAQGRGHLRQRLVQGVFHGIGVHVRLQRSGARVGRGAVLAGHGLHGHVQQDVQPHVPGHLLHRTAGSGMGPQGQGHGERQAGQLLRGLQLLAHIVDHQHEGGLGHGPGKRGQHGLPAGKMQDETGAAVHVGFQHTVVRPAQLRHGHVIGQQALTVRAGTQGLLAQALLQGQGQTQGGAVPFHTIMTGLLFREAGHGQQTAAGHDPGQGLAHQIVQTVPVPQPVTAGQHGLPVLGHQHGASLPGGQPQGQAQTEAEPQDTAHQQAGRRTQPPGEAVVIVSARGAGMKERQAHRFPPRRTQA